MKILIIDDEQECLDDVSGALGPAGYDLINKTNPIEALELAKKNAFDVIITDVRMPQMSGIEFLEEIKQAKPEQRVIVMTAYGDLKTAMEAINLKAYGFFGKPIVFSDLINTLRDIEKDIAGIKPDIKKEDLALQHKELKTAYHALLEVVKKMHREKEENS